MNERMTLTHKGELPPLGSIRGLEIDGTAWFVGKDVAKLLWFENPRQALETHVFSADIRKWELIEEGKSYQRVSLINQWGVSALIYNSEHPMVDRFKQWFSTEVITTLKPWLTTEVIPPFEPSYNKKEEQRISVVQSLEILGKPFSVYGAWENPLFLAKDVASWIEYNVSNTSKLLDNIDEEEKSLVTIVREDGRTHKQWFLTEDGLYEVLMQSRKPIAKAFKKEVKKILHSVRKHGGYLTPTKLEEVLLNPDTLIKLAENLKSEQEKNKELEQQLEESFPKVQYADAVMQSTDTILIGELAKILRQNGVDIGERRLMRRLRDHGYIDKRWGEKNIPTQKGMDLGLFTVNEQIFTDEEGSYRTSSATRVTGKGKVFFVNKFLAETSAESAQLDGQLDGLFPSPFFCL